MPVFSLLPIEKLQTEYDNLCQKILPSEKPHLFLTERRDDGSAHVKIGENEYQIIVTERGRETSRRATKEKDEFLYWMLADLTLWMAVEFEVKHRIEKQDFRRLLFAKQLELLDKVNPKWVDKRRWEINETLQKHPFSDGL